MQQFAHRVAVNYQGFIVDADEKQKCLKLYIDALLANRNRDYKNEQNKKKFLKYKPG